MIFRRRKREKECRKPRNVGIWSLLWWNTEGLCSPKYPEDEEYEKYLNPFYKLYHLQRRNPCTNRWLKHRCWEKKIIGKHAIKLKIHETPRDMKQANSKSINQTRMIYYSNRRDIYPSRQQLTSKNQRSLMQIIPHKHLTITIHTWKALHHRSCLQSILYSK